MADEGDNAVDKEGGANNVDEENGSASADMGEGDPDSIAANDYDEDDDCDPIDNG